MFISDSGGGGVHNTSSLFYGQSILTSNFASRLSGLFFLCFSPINHLPPFVHLRAFFYAIKICIRCRPSLYIFHSLLFSTFADIQSKVNLISLLYMPNKVMPSFCWNLHLTLVHTPSCSHDHKGNNVDVVFCFGCFSEEELAEPLPPKSSRNDRLVNVQVSCPYQG